MLYIWEYIYTNKTYIIYGIIINLLISILIVFIQIGNILYNLYKSVNDKNAFNEKKINELVENYSKLNLHYREFVENYAKFQLDFGKLIVDFKQLQTENNKLKTTRKYPFSGSSNEEFGQVLY